MEIPGNKYVSNNDRSDDINPNVNAFFGSTLELKNDDEIKTSHSIPRWW